MSPWPGGHLGAGSVGVVGHRTASRVRRVSGCVWGIRERGAAHHPVQTLGRGSGTVGVLLSALRQATECTHHLLPPSRGPSSLSCPPPAPFPIPPPPPPAPLTTPCRGRPGRWRAPGWRHPPWGTCSAAALCGAPGGGGGEGGKGACRGARAESHLDGWESGDGKHTCTTPTNPVQGSLILLGGCFRPLPSGAHTIPPAPPLSLGKSFQPSSPPPPPTPCWLTASRSACAVARKARVSSLVEKESMRMKATALP